MIELMFPQTVSNILDYDGIKAAAKKYVEDIFVQITESFGNNLVLQSMDEEHLAEVAGHVTGNPETTLEELLDYINTDNIYHEFEFVNELTTAFPEGVEYKAFEVTGWQFPNADFPPFSEPDRSYNYDGTPRYGASDDVWMENAFGEEGVHNLMMSRFKGNYFDPEDYESITWFKTSGRRASWGNEETWMTTGGFGKPSTIHINVDEARTVIEKNGLSSVENWLGTVSNKLPINLYIEINDQLRTYDADDDVSGLAGSTEGYPMAFPYEEEEGFCTNDPDWPGPEPEPEPSLPTVSMSYTYPNQLWNYSVNIGAGGSSVLRDQNGNALSYDSTKSYSALNYYTSPSDSAGTIDTNVSIGASGSFLALFNNGSSQITVQRVNVATCDSTDATIITVYDSSNNPYNAFKYTLDGTDYYYVLDGTQTDWTDDLASIGYHVPPAAYDTATGTISEIALPSAHSYIDVTFDSLRYYVKGTVSNIGQAYISGSYWYYGTVTWTDSSLGDLSSEIRIADPSDPNWLSTSQDVFRIAFITEGIAGYSPDFTGYTGGGQITAYSYNNGVHSITCYLSTPWANYTDSGRILFMYLDYTTTFNNLSAFDLVTISNGVLSKDTTTDRYAMYNAWNGSITVNAKYIPSPAPSLPTVSMSGDFGTRNWFYAQSGGTVRSISAGESIDLYNATSSGYVKVLFDTSKKYAVLTWYSGKGSGDIGVNGSLSISNTGYIAAKNETNSSLSLYALRCAVCSDSSATVITVYDSSNNPYNAFKYTSDGTDYYYVLDGTQTDWTDDLSGIGYHLPAQTLELVVFLGDGGAIVNFNAKDYWYAVLRPNTDEQELIDFGVEIATTSSGSKIIKTQDSFFYDIIDMYTGDGTGSIPSADLSNFWCSLSLTVGSVYSHALQVKSINAYNSVQSWKVRITENKDNVSWMMSDQSDVFIGYAGSHQLYDASGNAIPYDSTKTYTIVGYYTGANYVSLDDLNTSNNQHFSFINYNSSGYLGIKSSDSSTDYLIQRVIYKVE